MKTVRFSARIYKLGINPCVDVPERVCAHFGKRGYVPVTGALNGHRIRATLVPKGGGRHRLYINGAMRRRAGVDTGDLVRLSLGLDTASREIRVPADLERALRGSKGAKATFYSLPPSRRKEILVWVLDARRRNPQASDRTNDPVRAGEGEGTVVTRSAGGRTKCGFPAEA